MTRIQKPRLNIQPKKWDWHTSDEHKSLGKILNLTAFGLLTWFTIKPRPKSVSKCIYVVKIHRHSEQKHVIRQLSQQVEAIKQKELTTTLWFSHPYLAFSIFTDENSTIIQAILAEFSNLMIRR